MFGLVVDAWALSRYHDVEAVLRDHKRFANAGRILVETFGRGIHYCLGAPLALAEARIAFASVLKRFSSIRLALEPRHLNGVVLRGVEQLWVKVIPADWSQE